MKTLKKQKMAFMAVMLIVFGISAVHVKAQDPANANHNEIRFVPQMGSKGIVGDISANKKFMVNRGEFRVDIWHIPSGRVWKSFTPVYRTGNYMFYGNGINDFSCFLNDSLVLFNCDQKKIIKTIDNRRFGDLIKLDQKGNFLVEEGYGIKFINFSTGFEKVWNAHDYFLSKDWKYLFINYNRNLQAIDLTTLNQIQSYIVNDYEFWRKVNQYKYSIDFKHILFETAKKNFCFNVATQQKVKDYSQIQFIEKAANYENEEVKHFLDNVAIEQLGYSYPVGSFTPDGRYFVVLSNNNLLKIDLEEFKCVLSIDFKKINIFDQYVNYLNCSKNGVTISLRNYVLTLSLDNFKVLNRNGCSKSFNINDEDIVKRKALACHGVDKMVTIFNTYNTFSTEYKFLYNIDKAVFIGENEFAAIMSDYSDMSKTGLFIYDYKEKRHNSKIFNPHPKSSPWCIEAAPEPNCVISGGFDNRIVVSEPLWEKTIKTFEGHEKSVHYLKISDDGKYLLSCSLDGTVKLWDYHKNTLMSTLNHSSKRAIFSPDNKTIVTLGEDGIFKFWDLNTGTEKVAMFAKDSANIIAFTPEGYFECTGKNGDYLSIAMGEEVYGVDQFALTKNKSHVILERLGSSRKDLINYYEKLYLKRLKKAGFDQNVNLSEMHVPVTVIDTVVVENSTAKLNLTFSDSKVNLIRYNVYINDVPVYGAMGKPITGEEVKIAEQVVLCHGKNKVEVSCFNEYGNESFRKIISAESKADVSRNLYLLAFGVSMYNDASLNLQYAHKDALDLSKVMETYKGKGFENVYTKVLTNEQVTPDAIKAAKDFVKNAKVDDTFILFIAGHGMHDTDPEATYYYLTSNADLKNLKGTAADFETIEDLLQGIPPRNKLFLMDACESGEIDDEDQGQMLAAATGNGIASRGFKKVAVEALETGTSTVSTSSTSAVPGKRTYLYQKDRYIYNDLVRRSGAIVFSSSKGGELSYERSDIENGLFTEYIMKALTTTEADKDNNGAVSTDELRQYVSEQVAKASGDLQHPTVDRDNIYQKFGFSVK